MTGHTLVIELDSVERAKLAAGVFVFPEHVDSRICRIRCDEPQHCMGWQECRRLHICQHGHEIVFDELSPDGPCPGMDDDNCAGRDEGETFHGQAHTHHWGWGWTVPYVGCIVAANWCGELTPDIDTLPIGEHPVEADWWDDTECSLDVVDREGQR